MNQKSYHFGPVMLVAGVFMSCAQHEQAPVLEGPYLGQVPPGTTAEVFAPGIVSTDANEIMYGFFHDGSLLIFERTAQDFEGDWIHAPLFRFETDEGIWKEPEMSSITGRPWFSEYLDAPEGTVIVFPWRKHLDGSGPRLDIDLWKVARTSDGWAEPERFGPPVNTESFDSWPSLSRNETLYFFSARVGGIGKLDLYRSVPRNGEYSEVENLGNAVNTESNEHDPFIAPDESYLGASGNRVGSP